MSERAVEYLVIAGPSGEASATPEVPPENCADYVTKVEVKPRVCQRFPMENKANSSLPVGIEHFCRSQGWCLTSHPSSPEFNNFILTSELGSHFYCSSLNFYQPSKKMDARSQKLRERQESGSLRRNTVDSNEFSDRRRKAFKKKDEEVPSSNDTSTISMSSIHISIDEENEPHYMLSSLMVDIEELYEPISLCLVSKFPIYDALQALLRSVYIHFLLGDQNSALHQTDMESLLSELLVDIRFPVSGKPPLKRSFGPLKEMTLAPLNIMETLPYTSDNTFKLLKAVGVHGLLQIFSLILADGKILFISSSITTITTAIISVSALMYPMGIEHFSCLLIPSGFVEYLHCITPYLMGLHRSLLVELDEEPLDVTLVDLDSGEIKLSESIIEVPVIPSDLLEPVKTALTKIMEPSWEYRDSLFVPTVRPKSVYYQDKAVRAVFMNMFLYILGTYQRHVTVVRFHPEPKFHFNIDEYIAQYCVGDDGDMWKSFLTSVSNTIGFISFTRGNRVLSYRLCDLFDNLVKEFNSQPLPVPIASLFSESAIQKLAEKLLKFLPPAVQYRGIFPDVPESLMADKVPPTRFPKLNEKDMDAYSKDLELRWKGADRTSVLDAMSYVPLSDYEPPLQQPHKTLVRTATVLFREADSLRKFMDALFGSRILEARKYFPTVTMSLRQKTTTALFVPELVNKLMKNGPYLSSDQFEVLVRVVNCAIVDEKIAMQILPLTSVFYQEIQPGVNQYLYACIQSHSLWYSTKFWCNSLYNAVQAELVRLYADVPFKLTGRQRMEEDEEDVDSAVAAERDDFDNELSIGEVTLRHRQRVRSVSPSRVRTTARSVVMSKSARMRIRACTTIPGASEGVLPPDSKPVTSYEALHHLAKRLFVWPSLDNDEKEQFSLQEENAIRNQIILFISRLINIRTPIDFIGGNTEKKTFCKNLTEFIDKFLTEVDTDLNLSYKKQSTIMEQVDSLIEVHLNSLESLRSVLKKSPAAKTRIAPLPKLSGEEMIIEGIRSFLLRDGRDTGHLVPADGHVYLTSYRIVFLGSPYDTEVDPNVLVTRSMPIASIYRMKELSHIPSGLTEGYVTLQGLQLRSVTGELIRLGFDEESSLADVKKLLMKLTELRYPTNITVGVRDQSQFQIVPEPSPEYRESRLKGKRGSSTTDLESSVALNRLGVAPTQIKLISDLSQSPYCKEYERLSLGSLNFNVSKNRGGQWRFSTINKSFTVCESYPSVWVVPDKFSDESMARVSPHFQSGRVPTVTWKHPHTKAILLRSASFITPVAQRRRILYSGKHSSDKPSESEILGIQSADVEAFVNAIVASCPKLIEEGDNLTYWSGTFSHDFSTPPVSLRFDPLDDVPFGGVAPKRISSHQLNHEEPVGSREANYRYSLYASTDEMQIIDWEADNQLPPPPTQYGRILSFEEQPLTLSSAHAKGSSFDEGFDEDPQPLSLMPLTSMPSTALYRKSIEEEDDISEGGYPGQNFSPVDVPDMGADDMEPQVISRESSFLGGAGQSSKKQKRKSAHVNFASIPTNPRDWVVMDALHEEIKEWKTLGLYIIGEKSALMNIPADIYPNCTLLPVEVPQQTDIGASFAKLMRASAPSGASASTTHQSKFYSLVEDSDWINQLSSILQLSGAVADLMESQGSSVIICLEDGWDATAQVVSLAQILMDPYYRTLEGFRALIEKDWLAFGHPFSDRGCHLKTHANGQVSPVFIQFLDCVHQIRRQFPLSFEFNDFYLRLLAYHSQSMRFHTFTMNSEKERCALNWLPYRPRPPIAYGDTSNSEPYASIWEYMDQLQIHSMMFHNFLYQPREEGSETEMLRPHSYQANLDVWSYYTEDFIWRFPPYDVELISEGHLTYSDLHHDVFAWDSSTMEIGLPIDPPPEVASEITLLLKQCTGLLNTAAKSNNMQLMSWHEVLDGLLQELKEEGITAPPLESLHYSQVPGNLEASIANPEMTLDRTMRLQNQALHRRTSLAVLVKGKLSMQLEDKYNEPHSFVSFKVGNTQYECSYCHHYIRDKEAFKCKNCSSVCHTYCKRSMPSNCGTLSLIGGGRPQVTTPIPEQQAQEAKKPRSRSNTANSSKERRKGKNSDTANELEGFLFKKGGVVKNWKERYFVLNVEKKHLAYYESDKRGSKLCGKIGFDVISKVEECDPVIVPNTILKSGQVGYFFKLTTHRRVFMLMTFRASVRSQWLNKLETCRRS